METTPRYSMKDAKSIWKETYDTLVREVDIFKQANEKIKQKTDKNNIQNNIEKRKELKELLNVL